MKIEERRILAFSSKKRKKKIPTRKAKKIPSPFSTNFSVFSSVVWWKEKKNIFVYWKYDDEWLSEIFLFFCK